MMRNTGLLLKSEIAKNPKIAFAFENVANMTKEEIDASKFPKWIRQELHKRHKLANASFHIPNHGKLVEDIKDFRAIDAFLGMKVCECLNPDIDGEVRRWRGGDTFINVDRGNKIEVQTDKLLFFPENGGVYIDTAFSKLIDPAFYTTEPVVKHTTRTEYLKMYRAELLKAHPTAPVMLTIEDEAMSQLSPIRREMAKKGVQIY